MIKHPVCSHYREMRIYNGGEPSYSAPLCELEVTPVDFTPGVTANFL